MAKQLILRRYLILSAIFGALFGIRFSLDVWVFRTLGGGTAEKFLLVAVTLIAMLVGEIIGSRIAISAGFATAIWESAVCLAGWGCVAAISLLLKQGSLMYLAALFFGCGFGTFHSCVDAWYDTVHRRVVKEPATDADLSRGFWMYNAGYLIGAAAAFPLLVARSLSFDLDRLTANDLRIYPHVVAIGLAIALVVFGPRSKDTFDEASRRGRTMRDVALAGGVPFGLAVGVGAAISVVIQYIDHFAPSLIADTSVLGKMLAVVVLNAMICVGIGATSVSLARWKPRLTIETRARVILGALVLIVLSIATLLKMPRESSPLLVAGLLGILQAVAVALPPLLKAQVIQSVETPSDTPVAVSILGVAKRVAALPIAAVAMLGQSISAAVRPEQMLYMLLLGLALLAGVGTVLWLLLGAKRIRIRGVVA